jgi:hypothetical protein
MRFSQALILSVIATGVFAAPVALEPRHHTEAQIAAKNAAADKSGQKHQARDPHHTEAQIAAKNAAAGKKDQQKNQAREAAAAPPPDEFGPWDSTEDQFGSWLKREAEPEPHHTEAQIAAKNAAKDKSGQKNQARDPHHTEAQIAAKNEAAGKSQAGQKNQARDPHHTEAQIAAKNAAKSGKQSQSGQQE